MEEWGRWMEDNTVDMWLKWLSDIRIQQGAQTDGHSGVKIFETSCINPVGYALYVSVSLIYILTPFL